MYLKIWENLINNTNLMDMLLHIPELPGFHYTNKYSKWIKF